MKLLVLLTLAFPLLAVDHPTTDQSGKLICPMPEGVPVGPTEANFQEFRACFNAKNTRCIADMVNSHQVVVMKTGTQVTAQRLTFGGLMQVRVIGTAVRQSGH